MYSREYLEDYKKFLTAIPSVQRPGLDYPESWTNPTRNMSIVKEYFLETESYAQTGRKFNLCRETIRGIVSKWQRWFFRNHPPTNYGDIYK